MSLEFDSIQYQKGFKHQVARQGSVQTDILGHTVDAGFYSLTPDGTLTAKVGYSWDGASSFPDVRSIMRGSLFHDILYQMIRLEQIPRDMRKAADKLLRRLCVEDGMWRWIAWCVCTAVRKFGAPAAHPNHKRQVFTAP